MNAEDVPEAYLAVIEGGRDVARHRLRASTSMGRAPECDIVLASTHVSRRHAEVVWEGERFVLRDLGSLNGTKVAGVLIDGANMLSSGDTIEIAECILRFELAVGSETQVFFPTRGGLTINVATHEVRLDGEPLDLTPKEFLLLSLLHGRAPGVVGYAQIGAEVWPELEGEVPDDSIAQLAARLRRKLRPDMIANVRGFGYRLDSDA